MPWCWCDDVRQCSDLCILLFSFRGKCGVNRSSWSRVAVGSDCFDGDGQVSLNASCDNDFRGGTNAPELSLSFPPAMSLRWYLRRLFPSRRQACQDGFHSIQHLTDEYRAPEMPPMFSCRSICLQRFWKSKAEGFSTEDLGWWIHRGSFRLCNLIVLRRFRSDHRFCLGPCLESKQNIYASVQHRLLRYTGQILPMFRRLRWLTTTPPCTLKMGCILLPQVYWFAANIHQVVHCRTIQMLTVLLALHVLQRLSDIRPESSQVVVCSSIVHCVVVAWCVWL